MASRVVSYRIDDATIVQFEIEPPPGFAPASTGDAATRVSDALDPAIAAARVVLDRVAALGPEEVTVQFGVKVSGTAHWLVAKTAAEGNFEVTLTWRTARSSEPFESPG
jgi:hypothetical protein